MGYPDNYVGLTYRLQDIVNTLNNLKNRAFSKRAAIDKTKFNPAIVVQTEVATVNKIGGLSDIPRFDHDGDLYLLNKTGNIFSYIQPYLARSAIQFVVAGVDGAYVDATGWHIGAAPLSTAATSLDIDFDQTYGYWTFSIDGVIVAYVDPYNTTNVFTTTAPDLSITRDPQGASIDLENSGRVDFRFNGYIIGWIDDEGYHSVDWQATDFSFEMMPNFELSTFNKAGKVTPQDIKISLPLGAEGVTCVWEYRPLGLIAAAWQALSTRVIPSQAEIDATGCNPGAIQRAIIDGVATSGTIQDPNSAFEKDYVFRCIATRDAISGYWPKNTSTATRYNNSLGVEESKPVLYYNDIGSGFLDANSQQWTIWGPNGQYLSDAFDAPGVRAYDLLLWNTSPFDYDTCIVKRCPEPPHILTIPLGNPVQKITSTNPAYVISGEQSGAGLTIYGGNQDYPAGPNLNGWFGGSGPGDYGNMVASPLPYNWSNLSSKKFFGGVPSDDIQGIISYEDLKGDYLSRPGQDSVIPWDTTAALIGAPWSRVNAPVAYGFPGPIFTGTGTYITPVQTESNLMVHSVNWGTASPAPGTLRFDSQNWGVRAFVNGEDTLLLPGVYIGGTVYDHCYFDIGPNLSSLKIEVWSDDGAGNPVALQNTVLFPTFASMGASGVYDETGLATGDYGIKLILTYWDGVSAYQDAVVYSGTVAVA